MANVARMQVGQELRSPLRNTPIIKVMKLTDGTLKTVPAQLVYGQYDTMKHEFVRDVKGIVKTRVEEQAIYGRKSEGWRHLPGEDGYLWDKKDKRVWWVEDPHCENRGRKKTEFYLDGHKVGTWDEFSKAWDKAEDKFKEENNLAESKKAERDAAIGAQVAEKIVEGIKAVKEDAPVAGTVICHGETKAGKPCKGKAVAGTDFCANHADQGD